MTPSEHSRPAPADGGVAAPEPSAYELYRDALQPGNKVTLLCAGQETYPAMLAAIGAANRSIHLETFALLSDRTGRRFGDALRERARAGVRIRIVYDAIGSAGIEAGYLESLAGAGIELIAFNPVRSWHRHFSPRLITHRDHRKALIIDDRVAFVGSTNIGDPYASIEDGGSGWFDVNARVEGPVVAEVAKAFHQTWTRAGGTLDPAHAVSNSGQEAKPGDALASIVDSHIMHNRHAVRRAYLRAFEQARESITILNAYFIPNPPVRQTLRRAAQRGVVVKLVLPENNDVKAVGYASRHLYDWLLRSGIRILLWPEPMIHAKSAVVDGTWSVIGSFNFDYLSLSDDLEIVLTVADREFGGLVRQRFEAATARCHELTLDEWRRRPFGARLLESLFFQFRFFL